MFFISIKSRSQEDLLEGTIDCQKDRTAYENLYVVNQVSLNEASNNVI